MRKIYLVFLILFTTQVSAQITFEKTYGNSLRAVDFIETSDSSFVILAESTDFLNNDSIYIIKTDNYGNEQWRLAFDSIYHLRANAIIENYNDNYLIIGDNESTGYLFFVSKNGHLLSLKSFDNYYLLYFRDITKTHDNSFVIAGIIQGMSSYPESPVLIKIDSLGNILWQHIYGHNSGFFSVFKTIDNGFFLTGYAPSPSGLVVLTDSTGNQIFKTNLNFQSALSRGIKTNSNTFFAINNVSGTSTDLVKFNSSGTFLWSMNYSVNTIHEISNGFLFTRSEEVSPNNYDIAFIFADTSINEHYKIHHGTQYFNEYATKFIQTNDGGYAILGRQGDPNDEDYSKVYLVKTNYLGYVLSNETELSGTKFSIYPNPAKNQITITSDIINNNPTTITIYDLTGSEVFSKRFSNISTETTLDITSISNGTYTVTFSSKNKVIYSTKLSINR